MSKKRYRLGKVKGNLVKINTNKISEIRGMDGVSSVLTESDLTLSIPGLSTQTAKIQTKVIKDGNKKLTTEDFTTELKNKLDGIQEGAKNTTVDESLSDTSNNPIQNKVVSEKINQYKEEIRNKIPKFTGRRGHVLVYSDTNTLRADFVPTPKFFIKEISQVAPPRKTHYVSGESFDPAGLRIGLKFENGTSASIGVSPHMVETGVLDTSIRNITVVVKDIKKTFQLEVPVTVNKKTLKIPKQASIKVSTSVETTPEWEGYDPEFMNISGRTSAIDAGTYQVTFSLKDKNNYQWEGNNTDDKVVEWKIDPLIVYGMTLRPDESNPANIIIYISDNASYRPARMDYSNNRFDYGDWEQAWFIRDLKPVMMGFDGSIKYELNKNNYKEKATGGKSDVTRPLYQGNVMVGIPTVWIKVDNTRRTFYFANKQVDSSYKAYAHTDANGNIMPYTYMSAYECYFDKTRLRSISGQFPTGKQTMDQQRQYCQANGNNWDMGTFSDRMLITLLLMLIGKSTDSQATFGNGNTFKSGTGSDYDSNNVIKSGTLDDKGLFYGYSDETHAVKVFGIENFWGNVHKRVLGILYRNASIKYKLTKGRHDGSTIDDYSTTSDSDYKVITGVGRNESSRNFWVKDIKIGEFGLVPVYSDGGTQSTYYCDYISDIFNGNLYAPVFGGAVLGTTGNESISKYAGLFCIYLGTPSSNGLWAYCCTLSYKPLVQQ